MQDRAGQKLGNYRLLRRLGYGGFAEVYLSEHIYLKTQVAVKVLREKMGDQDVESFLKEAQTIAALKHPHILRVLDFGMEHSTPFLVMEYAPGGSLRLKHPHGSRLPLSAVVLYVKQVAMALQYAHDHKVVHRDVKPENMLAEADGNIVLGDFGIATPAYKSQSLLSMQDTLGTVFYMAPEQIQGKLHLASDQYALGIVVYEWLSGVYPFEGRTSIEIATQHLYDPPPSLLEKVPNIAAEVEQVVLKALAKEPQQRFATIQEFANTLEQVYLPKKSSPPLLPLSVEQVGNQVYPPTVLLRSLAKPEQVRAVIQPLAQVTKVSLLAGTRLYTYRGHSKEVQAVVWSPDGSHIASGSSDETAQVWNAMTGIQVGAYRGHSGSVSGLAWSPSGRWIVSGSDDGTVQVWDATTGMQVGTYYGHSHAVCAAVWSPDEVLIASGSFDKTVQVWKASTGEHVLTYRGHSDTVQVVMWSPGGRQIASGSDDGTVQVWDASTGRHVLTYHGHSKAVHTLTWSPDGRRIASGSEDGTVQIWDTSVREQVLIYRSHFGCVSTAVWSPNGACIASGGFDKTVRVWDASTGMRVLTYRGHSHWVEAIAWSPDGTHIASGDYSGEVHVWQVV
jgi:WD40 repeat protein/tRNA A-37 threonylcarbamoyl transferase component Bud32